MYPRQNAVLDYTTVVYPWKNSLLAYTTVVSKVEFTACVHHGGVPKEELKYNNWVYKLYKRNSHVKATLKSTKSSVLGILYAGRDYFSVSHISIIFGLRVLGYIEGGKHGLEFQNSKQNSHQICTWNSIKRH